MFAVVELLSQGQLPPEGMFIGNLTNGGVGLAPFHDLADLIPKELRAEVEQVIEGIIAGEINSGW